MPECKHHEICGLDANPGEDLCILHSEDPGKDKAAFDEALAVHRKKDGHNFSHFVFPALVDFSSTAFTKSANFSYTTFTEGADFSSAKFTQRAEFVNVSFTEKAKFFHTKFQGRTSFESVEGLEHTTRISSGTDADFRRVTIEPLDALVFRNADLQQCRFLYTDLRKAEFTDVKWPRISGRDAVYDEVEAEQKGNSASRSLIEQLYRQLKQNYEDRRDYEQARDFHYGEKEMRRKNPDNSLRLRWLLLLYRSVSGYGERSLRPLGWAVGLLVASTYLYLACDLLRIKDTGTVLDWTNKWDAGLYSLKVMTLLKPGNFEPAGFWGNVVNTIQSIFGPLLFGLFALALRQRLKR